MNLISTNFAIFPRSYGAMSGPKYILGTSTELIERSLAPLVKDAEERGFAAGWKAAMNAISSASTTASGVVPGVNNCTSAPAYISANSGQYFSISPNTNTSVRVAVNTHMSTRPSVSVVQPGYISYGPLHIQQPKTAAHHVVEIIAQEPGCTGARVVEALANRGTPINESTVRTALRRLKEAKVIHNDNGNWFYTDASPEAFATALNNPSVDVPELSDDEMKRRGIIPPGAQSWGPETR
jgi:hypothetical protein